MAINFCLYYNILLFFQNIDKKSKVAKLQVYIMKLENELK